MDDLTPAQEKKLNETDYAAWVKYIAPKCIKRAQERPDLKAQMWEWAGPMLRAEIRKLCG
jgi:hypothetical protein